jgi:polar amino acid transport system substrate-binding protein
MYLRILSSSLLFVLSARPASSAEQTSYHIGVENIDYYPHFAFGYKKNSFAKEVLEHFFASQNTTVTFVSLPLKRFNQWYSEENIDFKYPDNPDWRQGETLNLPITYSTEVIKLTAGSTVPLKKVGIARDKITRLGTVLGFYPTLWIDRINAKQTMVIDDPNVLSVIRMNMNLLM